MSTTTEEFVTSYNKWLRLVVAVHIAGKDLCQSILHFYEKFSRDEEELFHSLQRYQESFKRKLQEQIITQTDYDKIYPENGKTNTNHFNISLFTIVLEVLFGDKYKNTCTLLRNRSDKIFQEGNVTYTEEKFEEIWDELVKFLYNLDCNISLIKDLKTCSLERSSTHKDTILLVKQVRENTQSLQSTQSVLKTTNDDLQNMQTNLKATNDDLQETRTNLKAAKDDLDEIDSKVSILEQKIGQQTENNKEKLCYQVWEVMYELSSFSLEDWKRLAKLIDVQDKLIWKGEGKNFIKDRLEKGNITWKQLKRVLLRMNKNDVIGELCAKTNLTEGLDMLIKQHKNRISRETFRRNAHQQYFDLIVAESDIIDRRWREKVDEKDFHTMKFTIPSSHFRRIPMQELVSNSEDVTIITGIPGIGKTTLCEEIKYQWSHNQLWHGEIDLLLMIPCKIMNIYNFSSTKDLMEHLLPDLQDVELLNEISDRVLLLLDGIDEFQNIEEISTNPTQPNLHFLKDIIDQPKQELFSKLIITSRPKVAAFLRRFYSRSLSCAVEPVEICGFNDENIKSFVQKQFQDEAFVDIVMRKLNETSTMRAMSSVPIFLKCFCTVYKEDSEIMTPSTMTELFLYALLTFFKELYKVNGDHQKSELSLEQLSTDDEVLKHIINLSGLSEKTLAERKVIFFEEDVDGDILNELGGVGFLSKRSHEVKGYAHEYKHLVFQECTAALRILSIDPESKHKHYDNPNFRDTLPLVSGLEGILSRSDVPNYLKTLVQNVTGFKLVQRPHVKSFIEKRLIEDFHSAGSFFNTYVSAQSEYMEIPPKELISVVTQQQFKLLRRTVVTSQLINFLSFLSPHVECFEQVKLELHSSDDVQQLVDISRMAKGLIITNEDDNVEKWMEYFKKLSKSSEAFRVQELEILTSLKLEKANVEDFYFLCNIKRIIIWVSRLFYIEILEKLYKRGKEMMLQYLRVQILNDEELHAIGRLFKYIPSISIGGPCNKIINQYLNSNNKLKVLEFRCFPGLSLANMVSLDEVTVWAFPVAEREHMYNELKKLKKFKYEKERSLKVVKLNILECGNEDKIVDFVNSLNFVSDVSRKYNFIEKSITITI